MNHTNTGGPAFPIFPDTATGHASAFPGMTLRDYFAAKAMQASQSRNSGYYRRPWDDLAQDSYEIADAMLKARGA